MENQQYMKTKQPLPKHVQTTYERHGKDFYKKIGAIGGHNSHKGGFQEGSELAKEAGRKGGLKSRRGFHYAYKYIQTVDLNLKNFKDFTLSHCKYQSFDAEFQVQTLNHTIHRLDSIPQDANVPVFYRTEEGGTYPLLSVQGKLHDIYGWKKIIRDNNLHVNGKFWAEYYRGKKIITKEKLWY